MSVKLITFQKDMASLLMRWGLAAIFIVHGVIKVSLRDPMIQEMSFVVQIWVGWLELLCGVALAVGLLSRLAALVMASIQVAAIVVLTGRYALVVAPIERAKANFRMVGPEYNLILIIICLCVLILGSGIFSLDHLLLMLWRRSRGSALSNPAPLVDRTLAKQPVV